MKTRKLFVVALALVLTLCMTATAFAAEGSDTVTSTSESNTKTIEVTGSYAKNGADQDAYSVLIEWDDMTFTYTAGEAAVWSPTDHKYKVAAQGSWNKTTAAVKVTNHSSKAVNVKFNFTPNNPNNVALPYTGSMSVAEQTLATGVGRTYDTADSVTSTFTIGGILDETYSNTKLGDITVTIEEPAQP